MPIIQRNGIRHLAQKRHPGMIAEPAKIGPFPNRPNDGQPRLN
jgi:hypothetical protein